MITHPLDPLDSKELTLTAEIIRRAGFVEHDLWVTAFDPEQLHAPGAYVNQNEYGPGIPEWVRANRPLENTDVVL